MTQPEREGGVDLMAAVSKNQGYLGADLKSTEKSMERHLLTTMGFGLSLWRGEAKLYGSPRNGKEALFV